MRAVMISLKLSLLSLLVAITLTLIAAPAGAQTFKILHNFSAAPSDGLEPLSPLVFDSAGNLYGTTYYGGAYGEGTVFELSRQAGGGWSSKILHSFDNNLVDGYQPWAGVTLDAAGNIYGTTNRGGTQPCEDPLHRVIGCGTVFELVKTAKGYREKVLYNFLKTGYDGDSPTAGLIFDSAGNLYGTTKGGTIYQNKQIQGTVFELSPSAGGTWMEKILFAFSEADGTNPNGGVIFDAVGNLYGTTAGGGTARYGAVFELSPSASGIWTESVLHDFSLSATDVSYPEASLVMDAAGNLYGTGSYGGQTGGGGIFELSPSSDGKWTEKVLHFFNAIPDGNNSWASLLFDPAGNLYGTTNTGGSGQCQQVGVVIGCGTIFKLTPSANGMWTESIAYNFNFTSDGDVEGSQGGLISDSKGNFYGTTIAGGKNTDGTVFEFKP